MEEVRRKGRGATQLKQSGATARRSLSNSARKESILVQLHRHFADSLDKIASEVTESQMERLRSQYQDTNNPPVDYDKHGDVFARAFFLRNFMKAFRSFELIPPPVGLSIVDVGSGSGAASFAYLAWLLVEGKRPESVVRLAAIDRSARQLDFLKSLWQAVANEFDRIEVKFSVHNADFLHCRLPREHFDLVLMAHVLSENPSSMPAMIDKGFDLARGSGRIYVVEQPDEGFWSAFEENALQLALGFVTPERERRSIVSNSSASDGPVEASRLSFRFAVIPVPAVKQQARLVRQYFRAWRERSTTILGTVFARSAEYHIRPAGVTLRGLDAIKSYWEQTVLSQTDIVTSIRSIHHDILSTELSWTARFKTKDAEVSLEGSMNLSFDPSGRRVVRLDEDYNTTRKSSEPRWKRTTSVEH